MKISRYSKLLHDNGKYFIYNSISNFLCEINEDLYVILVKKQDRKENIEISELLEDNEIWELFKKKNVNTESEADDILNITVPLHRMRRISQSMNLTLAPTMDCNFYCSYCFETKESGCMSDVTINNIVNFIQTQEIIKDIHVTWFGGEPLLYPEVIQKISQKVCNSEKYKYFAQIITNGYNLTPENLEILADCKVFHVQISMDGIFEHHNKKRFTKTDKDTFSTIIKNIDNFHATNYKQKITIRINVDSENIHTFKEVIGFFKQRYDGDDRIYVAPAFILNTTKKDNDETITDFEEKLKFWRQVADYSDSNSFLYPDNSIYECAIRNYNNWAIDAKGDVYKCWEIMGNTDYKVGELTEEGIKITNHIILNRYLFGANHLENSKCRECFSLPICGGGCPHKRIENEFNNKNFHLCTYKEENIEKFIIERIRREYE
jgi:uncharacterized protein